MAYSPSWIFLESELGEGLVERLKELIAQAKALPTDAEARQASVALMRILLQHVCIALAETLIDERKLNHTSATSLPLDALRIPSDGTLVSCLAELIIAAENTGRAGVSRNIWKSVRDNRPCIRISTNGSPTLESILQGFVERRNDSVEGHGIPGDFDRAAEIDAIELALEQLSFLLPFEIVDGRDLIVSTGTKRTYTLKLLRAIDGDLICYRKISRGKSGKCIIKAQRQKSLFTREDISFEAEDILGIPSAPEYPTYTIIATRETDWSPLVLLPDRLTENFIGREREMQDLANWIDDSESRACMLFGDGGIGKTTLAVEFVHRLLEGKITTSWRPDLITFFTAKQTRWGLDGLESIRAQEVGVVDAALSVVRGLEGPALAREWFTKDTNAVIQKLGGYLSEWGISRKSHLLVLDNTETMALNDDDLRSLSSQIQELSRRIGRVLLTSRRRESIEARPIEIKPLDDDESISFLRKRGVALSCSPVEQAGNATLRQYASKLGNKPLVLEVFIQAASEPMMSMDRAFDRVMRMHTQDLGEFLYSDAWNRMANDVRHLLLLMTRASDLHDEMLMKLCCMQAQVTVIEASRALEESRGIASITTINGTRQVSFTPEFLKFCESRTVSIHGNALPTDSSVETIKKRYNEFLRAASARVYDRLGLAYRHYYARAAWQAFQDSRFDDCELYYDEAIIADSDNGWLFDRYAHFLFSQKRLVEALDKATRATSLLNEDPDVWFTRGMIEGRLGKIENAPTSLNRAIKFGKPAHLCYLQIAYSYLNAVPRDIAMVREFIDLSEKAAPKNDVYINKYRAELETLRRRIAIR